MKTLKISDSLTLPYEAVTQTFGILAKRGSGKTYTAAVMAEEMLKAKLHVVVIDPIGVWYGLRSSADGNKAGLPIIIAGGEHADIPIQPESGELLAELVIEDKLSIVVDISLFRKGQQVRFMTDFAETLYRKNREAVHLILDEADAFAPQRPMPGEQRLLGAIEDIVRRGRARGIGVTMITQRPSVLNKNVLTQIEVLVALRLTAPIDQKAVDEWVKTNAEAGQREEFMGAIGSLPIGTAYFWSPGWLKIFQKVQVRKRETLDSSSTPLAGQKATEAKVMASVDLNVLREKLEATAEKIESNDPKVLKRRIKELEVELAKKPKPVETVRIEVVPDKLVKSILLYNKQVRDYADGIDKILMDEAKKNTPIYQEINRRSNLTMIPVDSNGLRAGTVSKEFKTVESDDYKPTGGALRILQLLTARYPMSFTKNQLASLTGMSPKSGTFGTYMSKLKSERLIDVTSEGRVIIYARGITLAGDVTNMPHSTEAVIDMWRDSLSGGAKRMFDCLVRVYPETIQREVLGQQVEISPTSGTFGTYISKLKRNGLIEVAAGNIKASDDLFALEVSNDRI